MPIALTPHETWKYQLVEDRLPNPDGVRVDESKLDPNGTIWNCRSIPAHVRVQITDAIHIGSDGICPNRGTVMKLTLEHGIESVENWKDEKGNAITVPTRTVNGREVVDVNFILNRISAAHAAELSNAIENREKVTAAEGN